MQGEPQTFRNHMLSIFQSSVETVAQGLIEKSAAPGQAAALALTAASAKAAAPVKAVPAAGAPGSRPGMENPIVRAAAQICALRDQGVTEIPLAAPASIGDQAWTCARLGFSLLEARVRGDAATVAQLQSDLTGSSCDPAWASTLVEYAAYFGPDGARRPINYITPDKAGEGIVTIPDNARIAMIADWGTGTPAAAALLREIKKKNPDILIHLGDIYYSGTKEECRRHFRDIIDDVFDRPRSPFPVFTMAGNHDMYSGGEGYYDLIKTLNPPASRQNASFFGLRAKNQMWQLLAMDTGLHDYDPLSVAEAVTFVNPAEEAWHIRRLNEMKGLKNGQTILLSHHQLFSAFARIGAPSADGSLNPCNPKLLATLAKFRATNAKIAAWFWGHEHNLCVYQPYAGLEKGRCIGHGAVPVFKNQNPYDVPAKLRNPPQLVKATVLGFEDALVYAHGFTMVSLDPRGGRATVEYFQTSNPAEAMYTEKLG